MEKSEKVTLLAIIVLAGFAFAVFYHYILGSYLGLGKPYNTFLFSSNSFLCDFYGTFKYINTFMPYKEITLFIIYFPLAYILTFPFSLTKNVLLSYSIFVSGFIVFFITMNIKMFGCKSLTKMQNFQNIFILTVVSYPVLYLVDRGNFDLFLFVMFALFVYAFKSEKYFLASILLAVQNACKPFAVLFLLLFLFKKRYKEAFFSIILTIILIIGGFMILKGDFWNQIIVFIKNINLFKYAYIYDNSNNGLDHSSSLFPPLKILFCKLSSVPFISIFKLEKYYNYFCLAFTGITMFFVYKEKAYWKQIALLICNMLLTPYNVYDYKLIFLFLPIWLFVNETQKTKFDLAYIILFGLLFIPKTVIINMPYISSNIKNSYCSLGIFINPLLLLAIFGLIVFEQGTVNGKR